MVHKEGPNKGRPFYTCSKPRGEGCNFFQWGDEAVGGGGFSGMTSHWVIHYAMVDSISDVIPYGMHYVE